MGNKLSIWSHSGKKDGLNGEFNKGNYV
jgi:hypothetical protein